MRNVATTVSVTRLFEHKQKYEMCTWVRLYETAGSTPIFTDAFYGYVRTLNCSQVPKCRRIIVKLNKDISKNIEKCQLSIITVICTHFWKSWKKTY